MRQRSIARQVIGTVLVAQLLCAVVLSLLVLDNQRYVRMRALDETVRGRSDSLLGAIQDAEDPADNVAIDPAELRLPREDRYAVYNLDGSLVGASAKPAPELVRLSHDGMHTAHVDHVRYRVYQRHAMRIIDRAETNGVGLRRPVVIVYAAPETHILHEAFEGASLSLLAVGIVAIVAAIAVLFLLRRALRPLLELTAAAQSMAAPAIQFEPPASVLGVEELQPLARVLSQVTTELRIAFQKQQRFVGDAAHELKTAVAVVRSTVQVLMLRQRTQEEYAEGLERVLEDNDRVEELVAQMLQLARVESDVVDADGPLDLGAAADSASEQMLPVAEAAGVRLAVDAEPGVTAPLSADRAWVLLSNLLSNSIRHSPPGAEVRVAVVREESATTLRVIDRGSGIRAAALPHVFERFYRDDPSRSRETGGTGLGLAICKSIVETAGGSIAIESAPGLGTTVTVSFRSA